MKQGQRDNFICLHPRGLAYTTVALMVGLRFMSNGHEADSGIGILAFVGWFWADVVVAFSCNETMYTGLTILEYDTGDTMNCWLRPIALIFYSLCFVFACKEYVVALFL